LGRERTINPSAAFGVPQFDLWAARQAWNMYEAHQLSGPPSSLATFEPLPFRHPHERIRIRMHMLEDVLDPLQGMGVEVRHAYYVRVLHQNVCDGALTCWSHASEMP
jgi:hypothetical protein